MAHMDWGSELLPDPERDELDTRPYEVAPEALDALPPFLAQRGYEVHEANDVPPLPDFRRMQIERQLEHDNLLFAASRPQPPVPPATWDDKPRARRKRSLWVRLLDTLAAARCEWRMP